MMSDAMSKESCRYWKGDQMRLFRYYLGIADLQFVHYSVLQIRKISISYFRGIRSLEWLSDIALCFIIGPDDSGKSTILDAIEASLSSRWFSFVESDFFGADTATLIVDTRMLNLFAGVGRVARLANGRPWPGRLGDHGLALDPATFGYEGALVRASLRKLCCCPSLPDLRCLISKSSEASINLVRVA